MTIYPKSSSTGTPTGTPTAVTNTTDLSLCQYHRTLNVLSWFLVTPTNFNSGIFITVIGFYATILSFENSTNSGVYLSFPTHVKCDSKEIFIDSFLRSFYLQASVDLLYYDIM